MDLKIRKAQNTEYKECEIILRSLPEWFGIESSIIEYLEDIKRMDTYFAEVNNEIVGFITINIHNKYSAEIHVMGIKKEFHNKKIGTELVAFIEKHLIEKGIEYLQVKTLSDSHPDINYQKTRKFYLSNNFRPLEEMKTLWGEYNPCLIMIKKL